MMNAPVFGLFRRLCSVFLKKLIVPSRSVSLRVVQDDDVAALAGQGSADGRGKHHPLAVVLKFILPVDVVLEGETVAPGLLIPWR